MPLRLKHLNDDRIWIAGIWEEDERGQRFSMITTDPCDLVARVHDRMPAVLNDDQIRPYLAGSLHEFGPSRVSLVYEEGENFLKKKTLGSSPTQDELF